MDTEKFIECVKKCPVLYNTKHPQYRSFAQKTEIWERIAREMNESSDVLRTKWKGLKDGYTKYKKWILFRTPSAKNLSQWCWGPRLEFLDPYIHQRKKFRKNTTIETQEHVYLDSLRHSSQENEQELPGNDALRNEGIIKFEVSSGTSTPCTSRPPSRTSQRDPITLGETDNNEKIQSWIQTKRSNGIDAVDLLFMSYADTFKSFSVATQTKLKIKMATIFAEAELQEHNINCNVLI